MANTSESGFGRAAPVGVYKDNFGVHDMVGNVLEWTSGEKSAPSGDKHKIRKGGSFLSDPVSIGFSTRWLAPAAYADKSTGFRCVKSE